MVDHSIVTWTCRGRFRGLGKVEVLWKQWGWTGDLLLLLGWSGSHSRGLRLNPVSVWVEERCWMMQKSWHIYIYEFKGVLPCLFWEVMWNRLNIELWLCVSWLWRLIVCVHSLLFHNNTKNNHWNQWFFWFQPSAYSLCLLVSIKISMIINFIILYFLYIMLYYTISYSSTLSYHTTLYHIISQEIISDHISFSIVIVTITNQWSSQVDLRPREPKVKMCMRSCADQINGVVDDAASTPKKHPAEVGRCFFSGEWDLYAVQDGAPPGMFVGL